MASASTRASASASSSASTRDTSHLAKLALWLALWLALALGLVLVLALALALEIRATWQNFRYLIFSLPVCPTHSFFLFLLVCVCVCVCVFRYVFLLFCVSLCVSLTLSLSYCACLSHFIRLSLMSLSQTLKFFHNSCLIRRIQQKEILKKFIDMSRNWAKIACLAARHLNHYTKLFSVLVWDCNWIICMHGWFHPIRLIHLIWWKSLHFEKIRLIDERDSLN